MIYKLPKEVLGALPAPDSEGLVRVTAAIKVDDDGSARVVELNDMAIPSDDKEDEETDDANPMPSESLPDLSSVQETFYE